MARGGKRKVRAQHVWLGVLAVLSVGVAGAVLIPKPATEVPVASRSDVTPMATPTALDNMAPLRTAIAAGKPITVYGLGSSVGVGATLPDAATQAPSAYLSGKLAPLSAGGSSVSNLSVNGSVASQGVKIYRETVKPQNPTVLVLTYGMNDGLPGNFNAGQTFPSGLRSLRAIAYEAMTNGTTVLLATTPSPHTGRSSFAMPQGVKVTYPAIDGAALPEQHVVVVNGAPFSSRHDEFNKAVIRLGSELGITVLDVTPSWTAAVANQGEDALFNGKETVHPNLAGHTASYHAATDTFIASLKS